MLCYVVVKLNLSIYIIYSKFIKNNLSEIMFVLNITVPVIFFVANVSVR